MTFLHMFASSLLGYLCGAIPFGLILTKSAGLGDVREIGSGNIGATNVLRTGNKKVAALTLVCDMLKGTAPVLIATYVFSPEAGILAGLAAFFGHLFPIWLGFKGGKGVATNVGVLFGLSWPSAIAFLVVWLAMAFAFRISSLAALTASLLTPFWLWLLGRNELLLPAFILGASIWIMHRTNIVRLLKREEPRISFKKST